MMYMVTLLGSEALSVVAGLDWGCVGAGSSAERGYRREDLEAKVEEMHSGWI
jgi:hypothetical protein